MISKKGLVGDLVSMPLSDVFQWISMANKSGELFIQHESEDVNLIFRKGKIVYASSNNPSFLLGQILLRYRMITKAQLIKALSIQKKNRKPLGQIFLENKFIDKKQLEKAISYQIEEITYYLLTWKSGYFNFREREVQLNTSTEISVDALLMEGLRRSDEMKNMLRYFNDNSVITVINEDEDKIGLFDGEKTVKEVVYLKGGDYFSTYKLIYEGLKNKVYRIITEKDDETLSTINDPILEFLVALELFNKGKIYESYKKIKGIISKGYKGEQVTKFYDNLKIFITKYFYKKFGGDNSCFALNRLKFLDDKIYITPTEGFVLSRIDEYPCVVQLEKVVSIERYELYLIIDKLHKFGLLLLKEREENKTELLTLNVLNSFLNAYSRELTGEMEIITTNISARAYFSGGKLKFIYSSTDKYSLESYLVESGKLNMEFSGGKDVGEIIQYLIDEKTIISSDLNGIFEVYSSMIFYEVVKHKPISAIFIHGKTFPYDISIELNLLYMVAFAVFNNEAYFENELDFSKNYELVKDSKKILEEFGGINCVKLLIEEFVDGIFSHNKLKGLDTGFVALLNILLKLGYVREVEREEVKIEDLKMFLDNIKEKTPHELFGVTNNKLDIEDIKQKYLKFSKQYHPDLFQNENAKKIANEIFETIKFAYDILISNPEDKNSSGSRIDAKKIFAAEQYLSSGKVYLNMGKLYDSIDAFKKAYENFPYDDEIKAYYAFALVKSGQTKEGFKIFKEINLDDFKDSEIYFAYIEAAIKLKYETEANRVIGKAFTLFPEQVKKISYYQQKLKNLK
jgi:curved DNA-binding protein CbpA